MERDYIRLFCADLDIKPTLLIEHFLKYMGFYVEKIPFDNYEEETTAVYDIVVIGNDFVNNKYDLNKTDYRGERTIYIGTDGYKVSFPLGFSISYDYTKQNKFLFELVNNLSIPLEYEYDDINKIINAYIDSGVLEAYLFASFCCNAKLVGWAKKIYNKFLNKLPNNTSQLMQNIYIQLRFELDSIYKINKLKYIYDSSILLDDCNTLFENTKTFMPYLTKCEVLYPLQRKWADAAEAYFDGTETYFGAKKTICILGLANYFYELKQYEDAINILTSVNKKNYIAWYKLGLAYKGLGLWQYAIECFDKSSKQLKNKYKNNFLSPSEKRFLYKALLKQGEIYKTCIGNNGLALTFGDYAEQIHDDIHCMDKYIDLMLSDESKEQGIDLIIKECVQEATKIKLKEIY